MQADRSCSGVPIPADELERRENARMLKRRRATGLTDRVRRPLRSTHTAACRLNVEAQPLEDNNIRRQHYACVAENQLINPHQVVPRERDTALLGEPMHGDESRQSSVDGDKRHSVMTIPQSSSIEAELTGVDAGNDHSSLSTPDQLSRQMCNSLTLPGQRFTAFTIDSLLHAC